MENKFGWGDGDIIITKSQDTAENKYNPSQARDSEGKWTDGGGGGSGRGSKLEPLDSLNPTGGLYVDYRPQDRAKAPLADNMTTLAETTGVSPDTKILIYRGAPSNQKSINPGDFITDMKELAEAYTGEGNILTKEVRMGDILDDMNESLGNEYIYRPGADKEVAARDAKNSLEDKAENGKGYNPNRDKGTGRFTFGTTAQKNTLADIEDPIRANKTETFHAVNTKGEVIATFKGNDKQVKIPFDAAMKIASNKNSILTHNHPSQGTGQNAGKTFPFSLFDLQAVSQMNARGIRAVGETHNYAIARKGDQWPKPSEIKRTYNLSKKKAETVLKEKVSSGKMTNAEAQFEWYHEAIKGVAEKYDLSYSREEVK